MQAMPTRSQDAVAEGQGTEAVCEPNEHAELVPAKKAIFLFDYTGIIAHPWARRANHTARQKTLVMRDNCGLSRV